MIKKTAKPTDTIYYENRGVEVGFQSGMTVLEALTEAGYEISHSCGGMASCGTCRVTASVSGGAVLPVRNDLEQELADAMEYAESERLSCQLLAIRGLRIKV